MEIADSTVYLRLAVSAPRGVEFHEDVLVVVDDQFLIVMGDNNRYGAVLRLGDRLRLDAWFDLSIKNVLHELRNVLLGDLLGLIIGVFLVRDGVLDGKGRERLRIKVEIVSVGAECLCVNSRKVDSTLVLLCKWLQVSSKLVALLLGLCENVGERDSGLYRSSC